MSSTWRWKGSCYSCKDMSHGKSLALQNQGKVARIRWDSCILHPLSK